MRTLKGQNKAERKTTDLQKLQAEVETSKLLFRDSADSH